MRRTLAYSLFAVGAVLATPVMAQGVYLGPNGVGVDSGIRHHDGYDRDREYGRRDRDNDDEGRSVYRERRHHDDDDR